MTTAQSHSTTTVLFRTTFTRTILLNLLMKCGIIQEKNIPRYTLLFIIARASKLSNWGNRGEKSRRSAARERRSECILQRWINQESLLAAWVFQKKIWPLQFIRENHDHEEWYFAGMSAIHLIIHMTLCVIGRVRLERNCGKMYSRHLFPYGGFPRLFQPVQQAFRCGSEYKSGEGMEEERKETLAVQTNPLIKMCKKKRQIAL